MGQKGRDARVEAEPQRVGMGYERQAERHHTLYSRSWTRLPEDIFHPVSTTLHFGELPLRITTGL
jgi:hypothetical protein